MILRSFGYSYEYIHAGDIWSENGIAVFAVTGYWISPPPLMKLQERLLICIPFNKEAHTGDIIKKKTVETLHKKWKIGETPDDVPDRVHGCTPDQGSNMLAGWNIFEGNNFFSLFTAFLPLIDIFNRFQT